jgi:hypothetical protein
MTATATATVTATPKPRATVTKTVRTPGPTETVAEAARDAATDTSGSSDTGTCSIVSDSGNCYEAGQYREGLFEFAAASRTSRGTAVTRRQFPCSPGCLLDSADSLDVSAGQ